jgi:hypothetical protein
MYKIEKNIPILTPRFGAGANKYPFAQMGKGDSFAVPVDPDHYESWVKTYNRITAACADYMRRNSGDHRYAEHFTIRKDRSANCVRVWRI